MDKHTAALISIIDWLNTYAQDLGGASMVVELDAHRVALMETTSPTGKTVSAGDLVDFLIHQRGVSDGQLTPLVWSLLGYAAAHGARLQPALEAADAALTRRD